ncbi:MAG TPA: hypothetical protein EYP54_07950, partial [Anaerolineales bacterium]|nr:hypothetical protein [Anaerolineales bacterium]
RGVSAEIIELSGRVELAPLVGLSDFIVDLVEPFRPVVVDSLVLRCLNNRWFFLYDPGAAQ